MDRRRFVLTSITGTLAAPLGARAQQTGGTARIGILRLGSPPDRFVDAFRQGLQDLGYAEGRNIMIEYRRAKGDPGRLAIARY